MLESILHPSKCYQQTHKRQTLSGRPSCSRESELGASHTCRERYISPTLRAGIRSSFSLSLFFSPSLSLTHTNSHASAEHVIMNQNECCNVSVGEFMRLCLPYHRVPENYGNFPVAMVFRCACCSCVFVLSIEVCRQPFSLGTVTIGFHRQSRETNLCNLNSTYHTHLVLRTSRPTVRYERTIILFLRILLRCTTVWDGLIIPSLRHLYHTLFTSAL